MKKDSDKHKQLPEASLGLCDLLEELVGKVHLLESAMASKATINMVESKIQCVENRLWLSKDILTAREVCEYLCIQQTYLYRLTSKKLIPFYRPFGKCVYFSKQEIDKWIVSAPHQVRQTLQEASREI